MLIHFARGLFLLLLREGRCRQRLEKPVEDEHLDLGLGLLLLPEAVQFGNQVLKRRQQLLARLLDPLARRLAEAAKTLPLKIGAVASCMAA